MMRRLADTLANAQVVVIKTTLKPIYIG